MCNVKVTIIHEVRKENKLQLFLQAISSTQRGYVLYVSREELTDVPAIPNCDRHYLKMLTLLYLKDFNSLLEGLGGIMEWQNVPSTIILDGLNDYCSPKNKQTACGIVALLLDTAKCCAKLIDATSEIFISLNKEVQSEGLCTLLNELYSPNT